MNNRCVEVKVREDVVGLGVGKVPEEELEAPGVDTEVVELRPPPAGARSRERLLSRYAVVVGKGTKELGDNEEGEDQERSEIGTRSATNAVARARSSPLYTLWGSHTKWLTANRSTEERRVETLFEPDSRPASAACQLW